MPRALNAKLPAKSPLFDKKKAAILEALAVPDSSYTDLSPKGSVDAGIKDLIDRVNTLDGVVTTSSCAGRISVFLEGSKLRPSQGIDDDGKAAVPGGKGMGGRWLFVSHETVDIPVKRDREDQPISRLIGLMHDESNVQNSVGAEARFVKFHFEPMILHVMCASLHHAQRILSAAINAGFRESGVQSLRNLEDPNAFPMVAIRTAGLALSSIVGYVREGDTEEVVCSLVCEEYLETLLRVANARFADNRERIQRFDHSLFGDGKGDEAPWEDSQARRDRKRAEGLKKKELLAQQDNSVSVSNDAADLEGGPLFQESDSFGVT